MSFWSTLAQIGGAAGSIGAAPFTAGTSLAWLPAALGLGGAAIGGALANRKSARTGEQSSTSNNTYTTTPIENPEYAGIGGLLKDFITKRLGSKVPLEGYAAGGLQNINNTSGLIQQSIKNKLTGAGLGGSPIEGQAISNAELSRGGQASSFLNQLPLLERDMQSQDFDLANSFFGQRPMGSTTTSTGKSEGTFTQPGSALGGAFGDVGSMLGWLAGQGLLGGGAKAGAGQAAPGVARWPIPGERVPFGPLSGG